MNQSPPFGPTAIRKPVGHERVERHYILRELISGANDGPVELLQKRLRDRVGLLREFLSRPHQAPVIMRRHQNGGQSCVYSESPGLECLCHRLGSAILRA